MVIQTIHFRQANHHSQCATARDDRRLIDRIAFWQVQADNSMTGFVIGGLFLLVRRQHHAAALGTHHDLVFGVLEIFHGHEPPTDTGRHQCGLVHEVCQISTRKARCTTCNDAQIDIGAQRSLARVHAQDLFAALDIRVGDRHLTVEPARTQQCGVQNVFPVGRGQNDDAFVGFKSVHFHQKLVQRLFAFIVTTAITCATMAAHGVDLVNEDNTWRVLLGLLEHVPDA